MSTPNKSEKVLRIEILELVEKLEPGQTANFFHPPEAPVARELVSENLVTGSASATGGVGVTGIRDAGRAYLKEQRPLQKLKRGFKYFWGLLVAGVVAAATYVLSLESVKHAISDFVGRILK
ncbi:MAG: hypothetical protein ABL955_11255 [Elusimicrobiota bacterium]